MLRLHVLPLLHLFSDCFNISQFIWFEVKNRSVRKNWVRLVIEVRDVHCRKHNKIMIFKMCCEDFRMELTYLRTLFTNTFNVAMEKLKKLLKMILQTFLKMSRDTPSKVWIFHAGDGFPALVPLHTDNLDGNF